MMSRPAMLGAGSPERGSRRRNPTANITPGHVRAFQMITSRLYDDKISLWGCTINGEPGVAIVLVDEVAEDKLAVMPLFVAITPGMQLSFEGGIGIDGDGTGDERSPDRTEIVRQFSINAATFSAGSG